jgi:RimJ/RimL family protein N-acetyltransferase
VTVTVRRARPDDADFLVELTNHDDVDPFLGPRRARDRDAVLAEIERSAAEPQTFGRFVVEVDGERAGSMGFSCRSELSRIAHLEGLAVHPSFRGRRVADEAARQLQRHLIFELGYHRLELACYAFNERAIGHAERVGFVREGVKRKAYLHGGEYVDAVELALIREDLEC